MLHVTFAKYIQDYRFELKFSTGHSGVVDLEDRRLVGADFLAQFAEKSLLDSLAVVDAALRHLPRAGVVQPLAYENFSVLVEQRDAHARAVGKIFAHGYCPVCAESGARTKPLPCSPSIHFSTS